MKLRSSKSARGYSDPIPVDLLIDIFSRVSGKSVARFRCVSKFWASILRRPDFTDLFLTKSTTRPRLLFASLEANAKIFFYSSPQPQNPDENSCQKNSGLVATRYYKSFPEYVPSSYRTQQVCGLVFLQKWNRKVRVICNPATGQFLTLPKVLLKEKNLPKEKAKISNPTKITIMYLGYDPIGKQFKVLCMTMTSSCDERLNTHQVLTLETGKRLWKRIEQRFRFIGNKRMCNEVCINGVLYFGARLGRSSVIVSFDIRSEKFGFINTNEDLGYWGSSYVKWSLTLFNYKGKLGIHDRKPRFLSEDHFVLWVLEDVGNHKWSKHVYVLPPLDNRYWISFVGMTSTGDIVWSYYKKNYVYFYNLERKTVTRVSIQGFEDSAHDHHVLVDTFVDYVENMKFM
ncbi:hypothetical protein EUTSA_v10027194mg [Eutrema salsugineum]|uniref:F-box domain-containing protein n=1 Tax=Eutrema salsugineum TaxID=72664 RepID=V4MF81_EUTSA|nr:putative F-box protein At1g53360 [Eutrema salsugineum]ESQ55124.1 hypothetical protein EUTSA_v10027194mg [Eutrema salsugineum]